jgi:hypothetical protein
MRKRWRLCLWLGLLLLAGAVFLLPSIRWRAIGYVKGEAFYQSMPTSYWSREAQQWELRTEFRPAGDVMSLGGHVRRWVRRSSPTEEFLERLTGSRARSGSAKLALLEPEPTALPVLVELLHDPVPEVRLIAVGGLRHLGQQAKPALPALQALGDDENVEVRGAALWAIRCIQLGEQAP